MARDWDVDDLVGGVREGDRRALARAITLVENDDPRAGDIVRALYPATGSAYTVGVTGPPGAGKSSLIGALIHHLRGLGSTVGVISVDPSSPFSHGALLGDRIRLSDHFLDPGVFIRSMGARGHLGGLSEATLQAALLLDAAGKDIVILETVGTGQSEVEVLGIADTVVLVLMPGAGDSVQALKAGIMEIPDVIAINKMDHPAAKQLLGEVRAMLSLGSDHHGNPADRADRGASAGRVYPKLWEEIDGHRERLSVDGELERRRRDKLAHEVFAVASSRALGRTSRTPFPTIRSSDACSRRFRAGSSTRSTAVREIMERVFDVRQPVPLSRPAR